MGRLRAFGAVSSDRARFPVDQPGDRLVGAVATGRTWGAVILGDFGLALASDARRGHAEALRAVVSDWTGHLRTGRLPAWAVVFGRTAKVRLGGVGVGAVQRGGTGSAVPFCFGLLDFAEGAGRARLGYAGFGWAVIPTRANATCELDIAIATQLRATKSSREIVCWGGY